MNYRFAWSPVSWNNVVTNYAIHFGAQPGVYTNSINTGTNTSGTISNLNPRVRYHIALNATTSLGLVSSFTPELSVPIPQTNYIGVGIKTNGRVIVQLTYTNPPGDVVLFEPFIWQTNDLVTVARLNTSGLLVGNTNQP